MRYKKGDKVKVREWEDMVKEFGLNLDGNIKVPKTFIKQMRECCGLEFTIVGVYDNHYALSGVRHMWTDGMLEYHDKLEIL